MHSERIRQELVGTVFLWTLVKIIAALALVYYWEFGWVLLMAYVFYKLERSSAHSLLNSTEANEHISRLNSQLEELTQSSEQKEEELTRRIELLESKLNESHG